MPKGHPSVNIDNKRINISKKTKKPPQYKRNLKRIPAIGDVSDGETNVIIGSASYWKQAMNVDVGKIDPYRSNNYTNDYLGLE